MSAGRFVCLVCCPILAASCTSPLLPESPGFVTRILAAEPGPFVDNSNALFRIHVNPWEEEQDPDDPLCFPGLLLTVTPLTRIADSRGGRTVRASTSVLEVGGLVAVWHSLLVGPCVFRAGALAIERLE